MYTAFYNSIGVSFLIVCSTLLVLNLLGWLLALSSRRRSFQLFGDTPWLPLRNSDKPLSGEKVEFSSDGKIVLRGTFLRHSGVSRKGTILFFHELNGSQSNIEPYVDYLVQAGFDLLAFDFRNHGQSDSILHVHPTPWLTSADLEDAHAAIRYLRSRGDIGNEPISVFGLGKGATVALCLAGSDPQVKSVVLDAPIPENRLFEKNCWEVLVKSAKLSRRSYPRFFALFFKAILYSVACPFFAAIYAWRRFVLGKWFGCRFVNPCPFVKNVRQPIMIVHGHVDSKTRAEQIQSFCDRMPIRPRLWFHSRENNGTLSDDCFRQVARFFEETAPNT